MTDDQKLWIDNASYEELLRKWRFAAVGDPIFRGDSGTYYAQTMRRKRPSDEEHAEVSKKIGFDFPKDSNVT